MEKHTRPVFKSSHLQKPKGINFYQHSCLSPFPVLCISVNSFSNWLPFNISEKGHWTQLEFKAPLPPGRLDHSMCIIPWEVPSSIKDCEAAAGEGIDGPKEATEEESCPKEHLCLIFGGMDMRGELYKDCVASLLQ